MNKLKATCERVFFNPRLSFDEKIFNFIIFNGIFISFATFIRRIVIHSSPVLIFTIFGIFISCVVCFYICNKFLVFSYMKYFSCILICDILLPAVYFPLGGINSSMRAYFVLSTVIVFLLTYGRWFRLFIVMHITLVVLCFLLEARYPHLTAELSNEQILLDNVFSVLPISLCIGFIIVFQRKLYTREKAALENVESESIRQAKLMRVMNDTARILLTSDTENFSAAIAASLDLMGKSVKVDRICVWKNFLRDGTLYYTRVHLWELSNTKTHGENIFSYAADVPEFDEKLFQGIQYGGPVRSLSPVMRKRLLDSHVKSVLVIPVFFQEEFWGFVSFDDCLTERYFSDDAAAILTSGALMIANAVAQNDMEAAIKESTERVRIMLDASPVCCNFWNDEFKSIDCNEAAKKLFGVDSKQEFIENYSAFSPQFQSDGSLSEEWVSVYFNKAVQDGKVCFEWTHQKKDGSLVPVEVTLLRITAEKSFNILGYTRDLSEYKKMMHSIEKNESLLNAINDAASILLKPRFDDFNSDIITGMGLIARMVKSDRMYVWKNFMKDGKRHTSQIYEWAESVSPQQGNKYTTDLCYETDFPGSEVKLMNSMVINGPVKMLSVSEQRMLIPQDIVSILIVPVIMRGEFWGIVGFDDCVNERSFEEDEISILRSASLLIVTAILQNEVNQKLLWSREEALKSSRAKSEFLATMSHEIRTPLNAIIGFAEIQLQQDLPTATKNDLEKIYASGSTLLGIINEMLDISKIETGSFEFTIDEYDVPSLINDTVQLNIVRIGSKTIVFTLTVDENIPVSLYGDALRIKQVLNNILSNAFKYTHDGSVSLDIKWEHSEKNENEGTVIFSVSDTGIGIKKENIGKLFDQYAQFDVQRNRKIEGTGLGLFITKKLIDMMGGAISIQSEYGRGSVFIVRVPQKAASQKRIGIKTVESLKSFQYMQEQHTRARNLVRSYMPSARVLVVDDVQTNLDVARGLLLPYGLAIDCALSGKDAVDAVRKEDIRYDAIFMDHMMPEMDGIEAVRIIRNEIDTDYARSVPIIALTANALAGNEEMFLANGFDAFVSKPIDIQLLDSVLNQFIRDKQSAATREKSEEAAKKLAAENRAASQSESPAPFFIDGIDVEAGIERYAGKEIFMELLNSYMRHTPSLLQKLKALSPHNLNDYAITAHGLKGASYGILAAEVGKRAEELETLSKAGDYEQALARNDDFVRDVERLVRGIETALEAHTPGSPKAQKDSIPLEALKIIFDAAAHFKTAELEKAVDEIVKYEYADKAHAELALWLSDQVENLEYDAIYKRLKSEGV